MAKAEIKKYCYYSEHTELYYCYLFETSYAKSYKHIKRLIDILKQDFPNIDDECINIGKVTSDRYDGMTAVSCESSVLPNGYYPLFEDII